MSTLGGAVERTSGGTSGHSGAFPAPGSAPLTASALARALEVILPRPDQTWLLRACLLTAEPGRDAWRQWQRCHRDVKAALADDASGAKQILPLLFTALRRNGAPVDESLRPYLTTSYAREEMRNDAYRAICRVALEALGAAGISVMVVKGAALAETVYDHPAQRHCHDIDLFVARDDLDRAVCALRKAGFTQAPLSPDYGPFDVKMDHPSGLPLELHGRLFGLPFYKLPASEAWARSRATVIAGVVTRTLSPEHALVHVCGHASYSVSRQWLRWVCDAWYIIEREPELDWHQMLETARRARLVVPLFVTLRYLSEAFGARIPGAFLRRLSDAVDRAPAVERDVALFGARNGTRESVPALLQRMPGGWPTRLRALGWLLFPSRAYLRGAALRRPAAAGALLYVTRPLEYFVKAPFRRSRERA
ncbi:MAG: nucleotidyltransferase domain-containing protein [Gemmatimonadaceae bacterium]